MLFYRIPGLWVKYYISTHMIVLKWKFPSAKENVYKDECLSQWGQPSVSPIMQRKQSDFLNPSPPPGKGLYKKLNTEISCWQLRCSAGVVARVYLITGSILLPLLQFLFCTWLWDGWGKWLTHFQRMSHLLFLFFLPPLQWTLW